MAECSSSTLSWTGSVPKIAVSSHSSADVDLAIEARRAAPVVAAPHEPGQQAAHTGSRTPRRRRCDGRSTPAGPAVGSGTAWAACRRCGPGCCAPAPWPRGRRSGRWPRAAARPGSSTFGISAQSPMANTPGRLVAMVASVMARPARSTSTPIWATSGRWTHAAGPDDGARRDGALRLAFADDDVVLAHLLDGHAGQHLVAALLKPAPRVVTHRPRHLRQDLVAQLHQVGADIGLAQLRVVALSHALDEVLDLARRLDARESAAADHEGELGPLLVRVLLQVGALQDLDHAVAQAEGIGQRLHADRMLLHARDAEAVASRRPAPAPACRSAACAGRRRVPCTFTALPSRSTDSTSAVMHQLLGRRSMPRSGLTTCRGSRAPEQTSGSSGVKSMKLSRLTSQTSTSVRRPRRRSSAWAVMTPAKPPPRIRTRCGHGGSAR